MRANLVTCLVPGLDHVCLEFFFFFLSFLITTENFMELSGLGVQLERQLPAYATATAVPDLSCICDLHRSLRQCQILNPLIKVRD